MTIYQWRTAPSLQSITEASYLTARRKHFKQPATSIGNLSLNGCNEETPYTLDTGNQRTASSKNCTVWNTLYVHYHGSRVQHYEKVTIH